jgi:hypothetical protein
MMFKSFFRPFFHVFYEANPGGGSGGALSAEDKAKAEAEAAKVKAQEELNKQFAERAARAAEAERKSLLETLGVKDPEEAAALIKAAKEADDKNKSETEKLQARATAAEAAQEKAEAEAKLKLEAANKKLLDSEIKIGASAPVMDKDKVVRPAFRKDALDDVLLLIDRTKIEEKDGAYTNVDKALNDLAKAKHWLLEDKQQNPRGTPPEPRPRKQGEPEVRTPIISSL